jgi:guanylate kinase
MKQENKICFLMTGLSGAGKTSLAYKAMEEDEKIEKVITSTSRPIRQGEKNKKDYYFYNREEMQKMRDNNELYETADVYDDIYGSEKKEVERIYDSGHYPVFVCDVQGRKNLSETVPNIKTIFILPDSFENLKKRIIDRDGERANKTLKRLLEAQKELEDLESCDYCIINKEGKLEDAVNDFEKIIKANIGEGSDEIEKKLLKCKPSDENVQNLVQELILGIEEFKKRKTRT